MVRLHLRLYGIRQGMAASTGLAQKCFTCSCGCSIVDTPTVETPGAVVAFLQRGGLCRLSLLPLAASTVAGLGLPDQVSF